MLLVLDINRKYTAILENAFNVSYEKTINQIWTASFSLPLHDKKIEKVGLLQFIEITDDTGEYIGLFRVLPKRTKKNLGEETVTFELEHVLATLLGSVIFKYHEFARHKVADVIKNLLNFQQTKNWRLGRCDFDMTLDYFWENENLLSALFSITKTFEENAIWTFDTSSYPWTINLERMETVPTSRVLEEYNLIGFEIEENPNGLYNRIYPLGAGEGVNQVDIAKVNNGINYVEDTTSIQKFGLYETILVDKEVKYDVELLKLARKKLKDWKDPIITWKISAVDLSKISEIAMDKLRVGKIVKIQLMNHGEKDLLIVKESKGDLFKDFETINLELGNLSQDLSSSNAEQQRRQQVNDTYSQGATNIYNFSYQDNADSTHPGIIPFFVDDDVINVNLVELTYETKKFRAYSGIVNSGGAYTGTSGAMYLSEPVYVTSSPVTPEGYTSGVPKLPKYADHTHTIFFSKDYFEHSHDLVLPSHTHQVKHQILELNTLPASVTITVDGKNLPNKELKKERLNIIDYIKKDANGKVKRGKHEIKITPKGLARIEVNLILRVFIQSNLGGKY